MNPDYYPFNQDYLMDLLAFTEEKREKLDELSTDYYLSGIGIMIGRLVRIKRKTIGFRQLDLAVEIEVSASYISELENGRIWNNLPKLLQLMQFLDINPVNAFALAEKKARIKALAKHSKNFN